MKGFVKENLEENEMRNQEETKREVEIEQKGEKTKKEKEPDNKQTNKQEENTEKKFQKAKGKPKKLKKEVEAMGEAQKRKWVKPAISGAIILIILLFCSTIFALVNIGSQKIISGITISEIDVSGLTKEEANAKINDIYQQKKEEEISLQYEDYETTLNPTLMEVNYEVEKAIEEAYQIGKGNNIFVNNYQILFTLISKKNIDVNMTLNEDVTKQSINDLGVNLPGVLIESSYAVEEDQLIITKGKAGIVVKTEELLNQVKENLKNNTKQENYITIPVEEKEPEPIDIEKIHQEVYKEAKDAYYTKDPFAIYPEVEGVDFDVEAAKELLKEEKEEYIINLTITKPKITIDKIGTEAFPDQLATFTTRYDVSDVDRSTNLQIACQKINGKVILAGETFSYNKALGPRTAAAGYKNGKVYEGGEVVDGIGGGICQISSTLYNTVLMSNLEIVERKNHQFVTSYLPAGRDATVVYGVIDFKFKNTREYPVRLVATAKNGIATVSMYGIKEENEYTFSFNTKTVASIPMSTRYEEDASLPEGTEKIKQKGHNGMKTETYITKMLNGKAVSTTLLSKDTYDAMTKIIIKGTNASVTPVPEPTSTPTPTPEPEVTPPSTELPATPQTPENPETPVDSTQSTTN